MRRARLVCFLLVAGAFAFAGAVCSVLLASDSAPTASGDNEARDQRFASTQCDRNNARAITGTAGFNFLIGTPGDDILCGFAGRDFLFGLRGNHLPPTPDSRPFRRLSAVFRASSAASVAYPLKGSSATSERRVSHREFCAQTCCRGLLRRIRVC